MLLIFTSPLTVFYITLVCGSSSLPSCLSVCLSICFRNS